MLRRVLSPESGRGPRALHSLAASHSHASGSAAGEYRHPLRYRPASPSPATSYAMAGTQKLIDLFPDSWKFAFIAYPWYACLLRQQPGLGREGKEKRSHCAQPASTAREEGCKA